MYKLSIFLVSIYCLSLSDGRVLVPQRLSTQNCISTGPTCVDHCIGAPDGALLQTCRNCSSFIQCVFGQPFYLTCVEGLSFDDEIKVCVRESSTCVECEIYPTTQGPLVTTDITTDISDEDVTTPDGTSSPATTDQVLTTGEYGTEPTIIPTDCGTILRGGLNTSTPSGWDVFCYLDRDGSYDDDINKPCSELLENLLGVYNAADILAKGGNFGCWRSLTHPDDDPKLDFACIENYQHNIALGACEECSSLSVCVRFP